MKKIRRWAIEAAVVYVSICALMWLFQRQLIFMPTHGLDGDPADFGMPFETASLVSADGTPLTGWYLPAPHARATMLFCHGNGGSIATILYMARGWREHGLSSLVFDYRDYGASGGTRAPSESESVDDAEAAWKWLVDTKHVDPAKLIVWGHSLGGGICTGLATRHRPGALVLESTFTSLPDVGAHRYWWLPVRLLASWRYPTIDRLSSIGAPIVVAHSPTDEVIPFEHGRKLFAAAPAPKLWLELRGGHMNDLDDVPDAWPKLMAFLGSNGVLQE